MNYVKLVASFLQLLSRIKDKETWDEPSSYLGVGFLLISVVLGYFGIDADIYKDTIMAVLTSIISTVIGLIAIIKKEKGDNEKMIKIEVNDAIDNAVNKAVEKINSEVYGDGFNGK